MGNQSVLFCLLSFLCGKNKIFMSLVLISCWKSPEVLSEQQRLIVNQYVRNLKKAHQCLYQKIIQGIK